MPESSPRPQRSPQPPVTPMRTRARKTLSPLHIRRDMPPLEVITPATSPSHPTDAKLAIPFPTIADRHDGHAPASDPLKTHPLPASTPRPAARTTTNTVATTTAAATTAVPNSARPPLASLDAPLQIAAPQSQSYLALSLGSPQAHPRTTHETHPDTRGLGTHNCDAASAFMSPSLSTTQPPLRPASTSPVSVPGPTAAAAPAPAPGVAAHAAFTDAAFASRSELVRPRSRILNWTEDPGPMSAPPTLTSYPPPGLGIGVYRAPPDVTSPQEIPDWFDAVLDKMEHLVQDTEHTSEYHCACARPSEPARSLVSSDSGPAPRRRIPRACLSALRSDFCVLTTHALL